jgi:hypothetical protein
LVRLSEEKDLELHNYVMASIAGNRNTPVEVLLRLSRLPILSASSNSPNNMICWTPFLTTDLIRRG